MLTGVHNPIIPGAKSEGVYQGLFSTLDTLHCSLTVAAATATLALPQSIATTASPTFANVTISNSPSSSSHAATKSYVDAVYAGLKVKEAVRTLSSVNQNISAIASNSFNGVTLVSGDRFLLAGQTTASQNGLWIFNGTGNALTRPPDFTSSSPTSLAGTIVFVSEGGSVADTFWVLTTDNPITVDTTNQTWTQFAGPGTYVGSSSITISGSTITVNGAWVGQTSLTTLGTITTGTWNGTTIAVARGGTGVTTTPTNGQLLVGNGSGYTVAALTAGSGISVTNGAGSITLANTGVTSNVAGTDISVSGGTGAVTINCTATLDTVTGRGATTANNITVGTVNGQTIGATTTLADLTVNGYSSLGWVGVSGGVEISGTWPGFTLSGVGQQYTFSYDSNNNLFTIWDATASATRMIVADTTGVVSFPTNVASTSTSTGSLVVGGGVGMAGNAFVGGKLNRSNGTMSANGTTQGSGTTMTKDINVVTSATGGSHEAVRLPTGAAGDTITVVNATAVTVYAFPQNSCAIGSLGTNAAFTVPAGCAFQFIATSATQWYPLNAAYG